jgi:GNAT superfamily N-acetyltransferase
MSLDLDQVVLQIQGMIAQLRASQEERREHLASALSTLDSQGAEWQALGRKIESSRTTWLAAGLIDGLDRRYELPAPLPQFAALAVDGSHIDVDRNSPVRCYVINLGMAQLQYGEDPGAWLGSRAQLYSEPEELVVADPQGRGWEPISGALLGIKRGLEECRELARLSKEVVLASGKDALPTLALVDGTLILWGLAGRDFEESKRYVRETFLNHGMIPVLGEFKELSRGRSFALASYISRPRSTEVVDALRIALCPHDVANCDHYCPRGAPAGECERVAGVEDRNLFARLLGPGERSATFLSRSSVVQKHYGEHAICFFYLRLEDEVARVEFPRWVAEGGGVELVHALVFDQCHRGGGYPAALMEAHEQAVIGAGDRDQFWHLVEMALAEKRLPAETSAKSRSKRTRWI